EMDHFQCDVLRRALYVVIAPSGLGAPGTTKGTAAGAGHIQAEVTVRSHPGRAIALHVHEVPRRDAVKLRDRQTPRAAHGDYFALAERNNASQAFLEFVAARMRPGVEPRQQFDK